MSNWIKLSVFLAGLLLLAGCPVTDAEEGGDTPSAQPAEGSDSADAGDTADQAVPEVFGPEQAAASEFALKGEPYTGEVKPIEELRAELKEVYTVEFDTNHGPFTVEVYPELAPVHAVRFLELVRDGYYNNMHIHRIVPDWVIQWGDLMDSQGTQEAWTKYIDTLMADGKTQQDIWMMQQDGSIDFEPLVFEQYQDRQSQVMNVKDEIERFEISKWTVTFAKGQSPNSASTQPFVSLTDDTMGLASEMQGSFSPFGYVTEGRENLEALVESFKPAKEQAQQALRTELEAIMDDDDYVQQMAEQNQITPEEVRTQMAAELESIVENEQQWGMNLTTEIWDPFTTALITEGKIVSGPGPAAD